MVNKNAKKLLGDIDKRISSWNERSSFTLKGVKNLSFSDMEMLEFYAEEIIRRGSLDHLIKPLGETGEVLEKYSLI